MTVNEGLIPWGTWQNPPASAKIFWFQLSYLSYLFIFPQPGLMLSLSSPLLLLLIYFLLLPPATCEHVSQRDWQHSSGRRESRKALFLFSPSFFFCFTFRASWLRRWFWAVIGKLNLASFLWAREGATHDDWQLSDLPAAVWGFPLSCCFFSFSPYYQGLLYHIWMYLTHWGGVFFSDLGLDFDWQVSVQLPSN